jgi:hypothetical protein
MLLPACFIRNQRLLIWQYVQVVFDASFGPGISATKQLIYAVWTQAWVPSMGTSNAMSRPFNLSIEGRGELDRPSKRHATWWAFRKTLSVG